MLSPDLSLANKVRWNAIAIASGSLSRLSAGIIVARLLGPELNGQYALILWFVESLVLVFNAGIPVALNRFLALHQGQAQTGAPLGILRVSVWSLALLSLLAAIATYFLAKGVLSASTNSAGLTAALALLVAIQLWVGLAQSILTGCQKFQAYARAVVVSSFVLILGQAIGATLWGLPGAIYGALASYSVGAVLLLRAAKLAQILQDDAITQGWGVDRSFIPYARDAWLAALISAVVWGRTEIFFLDRLSSHQEAGFFAAGLVFSSLLVQAVNLVSGALLPHLSYLVGENRLDRVQDDYRRLTVFIALFAFPVSLGGVALLPEITTLIFGHAYAGATPAAQVLMAAGSLTFATVGSAVVYGHGDAHIIRNWSILGALLLVALCTLLVPSHGAVGAAAARLLVQTLLIAIGFYLLHSRYNLTVPGQALAKLLVAASGCGLAAYTCSSLVGGGVLGVSLGTVCGAMVYLLLLRSLRAISFEDVSTMRTLMENLPPILAKPARTVLSILILP